MLYTNVYTIAIVFLGLFIGQCFSFSCHQITTPSFRSRALFTRWRKESKLNALQNDVIVEPHASRRHVLSLAATAIVSSSILLQSSPLIAAAAAETASTSSSSTSLNALFTEKIFLNIQGLPSQDNAITDNRIVIGLFGNDAPHCVKQLQQLFTPFGLPRPCRPRATRTLQKEQLEANKVYKNCMQAESQGVVLQYSTVWRIVANEQIAIGAVTGKYLSREYPEWNDVNSLKHDVPGVVSVLRGSEGGFGFSIYPGDGCGGHAELDCDYIVVGRVLEGMDVVRRLNQVPVVTTARNINYMSLSGAAGTGKAPNRSCRYGGPMYCNEYKPLSKLTVSETGIL